MLPLTANIIITTVQMNAACQSAPEANNSNNSQIGIYSKHDVYIQIMHACIHCSMCSMQLIDTYTLIHAYMHVILHTLIHVRTWTTRRCRVAATTCRCCGRTWRLRSRGGRRSGHVRGSGGFWLRLGLCRCTDQERAYHVCIYSMQHV